jgi:hypothetical protein
MYAQIVKPKEKKQSITSGLALKKRGGKSTFQVEDNRPEAIAQRKLRGIAINSPQAKQVAQLQFIENNKSEHPIQKKVTIKGEEIDSIVDYLVGTDLDVLLSVEEAEAAGWMLGLSPTWNFDGPEDLLLFVNKVSSLANLIRSIFLTGILSRSKLAERGISYTGSEDTGDTGALAVNVLDWRTEKANPDNISQESLTAADRGSISVALERRDDWIKQKKLVKPAEIEFTEEEMKSFEEEYEQNPHIILPLLKIKKSVEMNKQLMTGSLNPEMEDRAMNTVMAVINHPNTSIANISARSASYESEVESGEIAPGSKGFTSLLIPIWFRPFYLMIEDIQPHDVTVKFVGNKKMTANYKTRDGQIPVEINAPDYASEISPLLRQFQLLATHILTA